LQLRFNPSRGKAEVTAVRRARLWLLRNIPRKFSVHYAEFWPNRTRPAGIFQFGHAVRAGPRPQVSKRASAAGPGALTQSAKSYRLDARQRPFFV
jgi:hypothetical protein